MCLEKLARFKTPLNGEGIGVGWKVFHLDGRSLRGDCSKRTVRPRGKWLNELDFRYVSDKKEGACLTVGFFEDSGSYPFGWHVFLKKSDAKSWDWGQGVVMVRFRGILSKGYQRTGGDNNAKIVIAKEIFIPE